MLVDGRTVTVQAHHLRARRGDGLAQPLLRHHQRHRSVVHQEPVPLGRRLGVQRHVRPAGPQYRQQRDHLLH
jgi:hypothetical protein